MTLGVRPPTRPSVPPMTPKFGCVGLCAGDGCEKCARLADLIGEAKARAHGLERDVRLSLLADVVAEVMGVCRG